jgi:hypothetical protein
MPSGNWVKKWQIGKAGFGNQLQPLCAKSLCHSLQQQRFEQLTALID